MFKVISFIATTCQDCMGGGTTTKYEFLPPFTEFQGRCDRCKGVGVVYNKEQPYKIQDMMLTEKKV